MGLGNGTENKARSPGSVEMEPPSSSSLPTELSFEDDVEKAECVPSSEAHKLVSLRETFMHLTRKDALLLVVGTIAALMNGVGDPLLIVLFSQTLSSMVFSSLDVMSGAAAPSMDAINNLVLTLFGVGCALLVVGTVQYMCFTRVSSRLARRMRRAWYAALMRQDISWYDDPKNNPAGLAAKMSSALLAYEEGLGAKLAMGIQFFSAFLASIIVALLWNFYITLITIALMPFIAVSITWLVKLNNQQAEVKDRAYSKADAVAHGTFSGLKTVLSLGAWKHMQAKYDRAVREARDGGVVTSLKLGMANGAMLASFNITFMVIGLFSGWALRKGVVETGCDPADSKAFPDFLEAFSIPCDALFPTGSFSDGFGGTSIFIAMCCVAQSGQFAGSVSRAVETFVRARQAIRDAVDVIKRKPEINHEDETGLKPEKVEGHIVFDGVHFSYPTRPGIKVCENMCLDLEPGTTLALVGASGSGKSTVVQLMQRFYDPSRGRVLLDGNDIKDLSVRWLRQNIGLVGQEPVLFGRLTIAENIALGVKSAGREVTQAEIEEAAKMANAHGFIMDFKDGYQTDVGFGGSQLSGGQKQRIAIARALIQKPRILLLDEATSALDNKSEKVVQETLDKLLESGNNRTTIVIAHRLSTIRTADVICYVQQGEVVEKGSHEDLMRIPKGRYRALVEEQDKKKKAVTFDRSSNFVSRYFSKNGLGGLCLSADAPLERDDSMGETIKKLTSKEKGNAEKLWRSDDVSGRTMMMQRTMGSGSLAGALGELHASSYNKRISGSTHMVLNPTEARMGLHSAIHTLNSVGHIPMLGIVADPPDVGGSPTRRLGTLRFTFRSPSLRAAQEAEEGAKKVPWSRIAALNKPDTWYLVLGVFSGALVGSVFPAWGYIFASMISTFFLPVLKCNDETSPLSSGLPPGAIPPALGGPFDTCEEYLNTKGDQIWDKLVENSYLWLALAVVSFGSSTGMFYGFGAASENLAYRVRNMMFGAYLRQEPGFFDMPENAVGAVTSRLANDATKLKAKTGEPMQQVVITFFGLLLGLLLSFVYAWMVALVALGALPFLGFAMAMQTSYMFEGGKGEGGDSDLSAVAGESLTAMRTVGALGLEPHFTEEYDAMVAGEANETGFLGLMKKGLVFGFSNGLQMWTFCLLLWFGGYCITYEGLTYEDFAISMLSFFFGLCGLSLAATGLTDSKEAVQAMGNIFAVLDRQTRIDPMEKSGSKPKEGARGAVSLNRVQFTYPARPDSVVCKALTIRVKPGQKVGLVGPSGSGKSTTIQMIERFYDPDDGKVSFDKRDVRKLNYGWLHNHIALVGQEPVLFGSHSIAENIAMGYNNRLGVRGARCPMDEIVKAATLANAHDFIQDLPFGYDTQLGAGGTLLSGGQKQRIAIARALIQKPKVLLLDEATSALDTASEAVVQKTLDRLIMECEMTTVVIAHRLSTVRNMDVIFVVDEGKVVESGSHDDLIKLRGLYHALVQSSGSDGDQK
ncbi:ABC transporter [Chloropicon primus]|uniref:ABC transporter n=2 Tax=Chloropicon primus TaxID=1764295 RepID=A0A5B8MRY4_9CHLO|nr:ABC transporter [Chloropicon primus]UPR02427.1 ABC transporter [Chloropicon primus]|eukprot:QDZ23213.1 ABC transporter [Chloropicon primus]